ncbi:MAG: glycosyltransferase family 4 protein [Thermodesulfobacteriota bacterium]
MKILFIRQYAPGFFSTFIDKDFDILREEHEVVRFDFRGFQDLPAMVKKVQWCDLTFSWFGKLHAFFAVLLSKLLDKKSIVVSGDDDVTNYIVAGKPYGLCAHPIKRYFAYFIFSHTDLAIAISEFGLQETIFNAKADPKRTMLIYHGFDHSTFKLLPGIIKQGNIVITVAHINEENYHRKGLKLFVDCANLMKDINFIIVGPSDLNTLNLLKNRAGSNVSFIGPQYGQNLIETLGKASVYVQASEWESFGCSVAEAMLCECVPVVSKRTGLPEVVGDAGYYLEYLSPQELADTIKTALVNPQVGKLARQRIIEHFPLEKRRKELLETTKSLMGGMKS